VKVRLLTVGRPRDRAAATLHDEYASRLERLGVAYRADSVPEVRAGGRFSDAHVRERESRALLDALAPRERLVALDPGGTQWSSEDLAGLLERWASPGACFAVGGPLGHAPELLDRAEARWSLSRLTFPHELVRVLVAEQLYRSVTILRGLPYHRGSP
jgi:23S rRNA (pseudouridine1915-N3)-methyltransferase